MDNEKNTEPIIMHSFQEKNPSIFSITLVLVLLLVAILGVGTGYFITKNKGKISPSVGTGGDSSSATKGSVIGSDDFKTFKDSVEGKLQKGGLDDEGQYHLIRPGGESQNVYLTSSTLDLSSFVEKKIKVWGQTQKAQKAGWLMDVGRVEVLE